MRISENILISSLTTIKLGGLAKYVIEIESLEDIPRAYSFAHFNNLPTFILGYGANTIGHDDGFNGVIIINRIRGISTTQTPTGTDLIAMGGEYWDNVVEYACNQGLTGIEALSKIPGLAGAAPVQNIGAYGQEISDTLIEIQAYDTATDTFRLIQASDLNFAYRQSILNTTAKNRYFVISIRLKLTKGSMPRPFYNSIESYIETNNITDFSPLSIRKIVSEIRNEKIPNPLESPNSGSFFKNVYLDDHAAEIAGEKGYPVYRGKDGNKINSGWLIEQSGLKGKLLHGFRINSKSPLILVNESAKKFSDLTKARGEITSAVYDKFGYWLEQEPVEIIPNPPKGNHG